MMTARLPCRPTDRRLGVRSPRLSPMMMVGSLGSPGNGTVPWTADGTPNTGNDIDDADESEYKPVAADGTMYLHAVASYTDSKGSGKMATGVTENAVRADTANRPPMFLDEDDEVVTAYQRSVAEDRADMADRTDPAPVGDPCYRGGC